MAVDRGGLRYTISVEDRFSRQLTRLQEKLDRLERSMKRVGSARRRVDEGGGAGRGRQNAARRGARQQVAATERVTAAKTRQSAVERKAAAATRANTRETDKNTAANRRNASSVNRISFSFRRLVGILAVFQAARVGANLFTGAVRGGVQFNQTVEDSQIAMASLFTTVGRVRDAQGRLVTGAAGFAEAQKIARRQTELLRIDAIQTTATFEELQRAFQVGIGPGLEAGLNLDEIRNITVRISQAAAALGLQQNQLAEEIRSLLRGTIQARTTVVATVLGITNADIARAKQAGNLAEFLRERLDGFRFAALATQQSFTGLTARLRDTFSVAAGTAGEGLFTELKVTLGEISSLFVTLERNSKGAVTSITPSPATVVVFREIFDALREGVVIVREGLSQLSFDALASSFAGLGGAIRVVASVSAGLIQGVVQGFAVASDAIGGVISAAGGLDAILPIVEQIALFVGKWGTVAIVFSTGLALVRGLLSPIIGLASTLAGVFTTIVGSVVKMVLAIGAIPLPILAVVAALAVGVGLLNDWIKSVTGFQVRLGTLVRVIKEGFFNVLVLIAAKIRELFLGTFVTSVVQAVITVFEKSLEVLATGLQKLESVLAKSSLTSGVADSIGDLAGNLRRVQSDFTVLNKQADDFKKSLEEATESAAKQVLQDFQVAVAEDDQAFDLGASIDEQVQAVVELLSGVVGPELVDKDQIKKDIKEAVEQGTVEGGNAAGKGQQSPLTRFADNIVTNFESGLFIIRTLTQQTAAFISDLIVDALDPNKKVDLQERFARLFQGIAKAIIAELVRIAIAKTILKITAADEGGQVGLAKGGQPKQFYSRRGALGFDGGGKVPGGHFSTPNMRPKGVAKSDTVNAWLTPKEFVHPVHSVNRYGADLMELMRRGAIDPGALRAVAGLDGRRAAKVVSASHGRRGYAEGGSVVSPGDQRAAGATEGEDRVVGATVIANDQSMDRLLSGGKNSMLSFIADNAATIDGMLKRNR